MHLLPTHWPRVAVTGGDVMLALRVGVAALEAEAYAPPPELVG